MDIREITAYPDVNLLVRALLDGVTEILGKQLVGMYLFGSLAMGEFDSASDIDVAVVTEAEITPRAFEQLGAMHRRLAKLDSPWAMHMEVSYLKRDMLRRYDAQNALHPQLERGQNQMLVMENHARTVERHVLREHGIVVVGTPLRELIDPVSADDLRDAAREVLRDWIVPLVQETQPFDSRGYQSYTVLSLCRLLYTLEYGGVATKPQAARWAQARFGERWTGLIERAPVGRHNSGLPVDEADAKETVEFGKFVLARAAQAGFRQ